MTIITRQHQELSHELGLYRAKNSNQSWLACQNLKKKKLPLIKHLIRNKQTNCAWNFIRFHWIFLFSKPIKSKTFYCAKGETVQVHIFFCVCSVSELVGGGKVVFDTNFIRIAHKISSCLDSRRTRYSEVFKKKKKSMTTTNVEQIRNRWKL